MIHLWYFAWAMESHTHVSFDLLGNLESYFNEEFKTEDIENERLDTASQLLLIIFVLRIWTLKVEIYVTIPRVFPVHFIVWLTPNKESASRTHTQNKSPVLTDDECLTIHVPKCLKKGDCHEKGKRVIMDIWIKLLILFSTFPKWKFTQNIF
mgnify:CR=1 FL=1